MTRRIVAVVGLFLVLALGVCSSAQAALTAFWRNNAITPQAIADDPALAGMQSWSVMVTHTNGYWKFAGARLTLPTGNTFYRDPLGGSFLPSRSAIDLNPALEFHTYVTTPHHIVGNHIPAVISGFPEPEPHSFGGPLDLLPGIFSITWGNPETVNHPTPVGTYEILRVTFSDGVLPSVHPQSYTLTFSPQQTALIPNIPEPAKFVAVFALGLGLNLRLRGRLQSVTRCVTTIREGEHALETLTAPNPERRCVRCDTCHISRLIRV